MMSLLVRRLVTNATLAIVYGLVAIGILIAAQMLGYTSINIKNSAFEISAERDALAEKNQNNLLQTVDDKVSAIERHLSRLQTNSPANIPRLDSNSVTLNQPPPSTRAPEDTRADIGRFQMSQDSAATLNKSPDKPSGWMWIGDCPRNQTVKCSRFDRINLTNSNRHVPSLSDVESSAQTLFTVTNNIVLRSDKPADDEVYFNGPRPLLTATPNRTQVRVLGSTHAFVRVHANQIWAPVQVEKF